MGGPVPVLSGLSKHIMQRALYSSNVRSTASNFLPTMGTRRSGNPKPC